MDRAGEWSDTLGALARGLEEESIIELLDHWEEDHHRDGDYVVTFVGRGSGKSRLVGRLLGRPFTESTTDAEYTHDDAEAVPPGVRWLDTVPFDAVDCSAGGIARQLRRSDAVVLVVAAASAANTADVELLRNQVVGGAHVPRVSVVVTGASDLEPSEKEVVIRYVRRTLGTLSPRVVVSAEPPEQSPEGPRWRAELLPAGPPADLAAVREDQTLAQLGALAADLENAALRRAEVADTEARMDAGRLSEAETHAERRLDVAAVRRELLVRRQFTTEVLAECLDASRRQLSDEADRALRDSRGEEDAIRAALDRYRERVDALLAEVQSRATSAVETDVRWLNEQLATYAEAWQVAHREQVRPDLGGSRTLAELGPLPAVRESRVLKTLAATAGAFAGIAVNIAGEALQSRFEGLDRKDLKRVTRVALKAGERGAPEISAAVRDVVSDGIAQLVERLDGDRRIGRAKTMVLEADRSLDADRDLLTAAVAAAYDALSREFDDARRDWREAQQKRARQRLTGAGDRWRDAANRARSVRDEIATAISTEERD